MPGKVRTDRAARLAGAVEGRDGHAAALRRAEAASGSAQRPPRAAPDEPSYYDVPMLKPPVWKWEIAGYFFLGGLSAGSYLLARMAERFGGGRHRDVTRTGTWVSFLTSLPCAPLLIRDLGDPSRFHHMLRVWKPSTPMNLGTWTLVAYSGTVAAALLRELLFGRRREKPEERILGQAVGRGAMAAHDAAGVPLAVGVAGYTGVLLSCTANPMWCKNPWIGPLFSAGAVSTGAEAISLAMAATGSGSERSQQMLGRIGTAAHVAEAVAAAGYLAHAGEGARPVIRGSMRNHARAAIAGAVASELLKAAPVHGRAKQAAHLLSAVAGLVSGFSLRWAMVYGGQEAASDPHLARAVSRPRRRRRAPRKRSLAAASGRLAHGRQRPSAYERPEIPRSSPAPPYAPEPRPGYSSPDRRWSGGREQD